MKSLVLNSLAGDDLIGVLDLLKNELNNQGTETIIMDLNKKNIDYCPGCGYCGAREPGICIKKDDMREIIPEMLRSDLMVFLTKVSFGGYNAVLKKVVDRFMVINSSFYTIYQDEFHHKNRYPEFPALLTIGLLKEEDPEQSKTFRSLTERNAINFTAPQYAAVTIVEKGERASILSDIRAGLEKLGV